jgi:streptogramin lyase
MRVALSLAAAVYALIALSAAQAGTLEGRVVSDGQPVAGAMITAIDATARRRDTVYTDAQGRFTLTVDFAGAATVRARAPYFKDAIRDIQLGADAARTVDFTLVRHSVAEELSASLPASAHLTTLAFPGADTRAAFVSQCNYCHQMGNALTRSPKDQAGWKATVDRMEGYFAMLTPKEARDITKVLTAGFDGKPIQAAQRHVFHPEVARAKIKEWVVGDAASFIHDADVGEDEHLYGSDEGHDIIWDLDRRTGRIAPYKLPDIDLPEGGVFSGVQLPIGVFTGKHGPHSMAQARDGRFWITNALSSTLASFDPATKAFELYDIGRTHLYPHTVRIDREGIVWFTITASNEVGRFDPASGKFTIIRLPHNGAWNAVSDYLFPYILKIAAWFPKRNLQLAVSHHRWANQGRGVFSFPYGIDVDPVDGAIWYAKLNVHKIGRIDPKTLAVTEYDTPLRGPRRPRFDKNGILWIPAFDDGGLMRFDPRTARFENFKLPLLAHDEYEVPYALNVHPQTGDVWITSNMSDRMFRFDPRTRTFVTYPMPTRVTWLRDLVFARDGGICSSSSNLPAYGIEGGLASFICLYPDGELPVAKPATRAATSTTARAVRVASR